MKSLTALAVLFMAAAPIIGQQPQLAQQPCGDGIPCRPVVWELPQLPQLVSPTPLSLPGDNLDVPTNTPTVTPTRTPLITSSPIATLTPFMDTGDLEDRIATLQALMDGTAIPVLNASGTPVTIQTQVAGIGSNADTFIGYARTLQTSNLTGPFAPLLALLFSGALLVILFKAVTYILPVLLSLWGIIRKVATVIMDFLPF